MRRKNATIPEESERSRSGVGAEEYNCLVTCDCNSESEVIGSKLISWNPGNNKVGKEGKEAGPGSPSW